MKTKATKTIAKPLQGMVEFSDDEKKESSHLASRKRCCFFCYLLHSYLVLALKQPMMWIVELQQLQEKLWLNELH